MVFEIYGWLFCLGWWLLRLIVWVIFNLVTGFIHRQPRTAHRWLITPAIFATMWICLMLRLPLYASFFVSLSAMNRAAQQVINIPGPPANVSWIGVYAVKRLETIPGGMRFLVSGSGFLDAGGFAYSPNGIPPKLGDDYYRHLSGAWYEWTERF